MDQITVTALPDLSPEHRAEVERVVAEATATDGSAPLSEQFTYDLRRPSGASHLLAYAGPALAGYAQVHAGAAELVVAPTLRRRGVGTALLTALPKGTEVWTHGSVPAAEAFAAAHHLSVSRELFVLGRTLGDGPPLPAVVLPQGLAVRSFEPGRDEDELLRVNAAAFADHPEQGALTRADLDERMTQAWFDSRGLLLVVPRDDPDTVAAFHWTKIHSPGTPAAGTPRGRTGEVYVVGVHPAYQGQGLGVPVTLLGLEYLREQGVREVFLYVDGDNAPAITVYRRLGFEARGVDRMYSRADPRE